MRLNAHGHHSTWQAWTQAGVQLRRKQGSQGCKCSLVVNTLRLLLALCVTSASVQDRDVAAPVVAQAMTKVPGLRKLYTDGVYGSRCARTIETMLPTLAVEAARYPGNRHTGSWQDAQQPLWHEAVVVAL